MAAINLVGGHGDIV
jgi:hypothetical protein